MTQPQQSTLARKWRLEVNTNTVASPIWTIVMGMAEFKPTFAEPNLEDDNVYEDEGYTGQTKTALGWSATGKVMRRTDPDDDTIYDPGQEKLRLLGLTLGPGGVAHCRIVDREGGPEAYTGFAEVSWSPDGGDSKALESVSFTLTGKGQPTLITNPTADALPAPTVTSVSPATGPAAGGTLVKIIGQNFTSLSGGAAAVKFGATDATSYFVESSQVIYAVAPAHAAGSVDVIVTNTTGASAGAGTGNDYVYV